MDIHGFFHAPAGDTRVVSGLHVTIRDSCGHISFCFFLGGVLLINVSKMVSVYISWKLSNHQVIVPFSLNCVQIFCLFAPFSFFFKVSLFPYFWVNVLNFEKFPVSIVIPRNSFSSFIFYSAFSLSNKF